MVDALADAPTLHTAQITYVEVYSALARMLKGARLEADEHDEKRSEFEAFWRDVARVEIDEELVVDAAQLATAHGLRGYDAVQLAAAKRVAAAEALAFASWDSELVLAGEREGLTMLPHTA